MQAWYALAFAMNALSTPRSVPVQFAKSLSGRMVSICIDGRVERTFAGKMGFRDANYSWTSVCADVRSPVREGQFFIVRVLDSARVGGNYVRAGNIVARFFRSAQTPDQCAGLQLAVWKAIEDGGDQPDFAVGHFAAMAPPAVMAFAAEFYQGGETPGAAAMLYAAGGGQSQLTPI